MLNFPPFRLDMSSEQLWHEDKAIALRPKTFAVLRYLVEHPEQLVTKDELLDTVWAGTVVSDTVLKSCIRELREALSDDAQAPQYIATVHRRGYRFIREVVSRQQSVLSSPPPPPQSSALSPQSLVVVGREADLAQLHRLLDKALAGERQFVFVTGEAGIGKTTLVETFVFGVRSHEQFGVPQPPPQTPNSALPSTSGPWLARGQCIEQYGAGEAYMPILEALGRLCREPGGERLIELLNYHAPTWLVQMPMLLSTPDLEVLQRKVQGATRERMLREMAEAIDVITVERPLVLWLEDLHWSDVSTLELLALLARRREPARLLVLGTYRPVDVIVNEHPLRAAKQELQLHGQCEELAVRLLSEEAVTEYLAVRFAANVEAQHTGPLEALAHTIHQRTEGNPLFMVNVVDEMLTQEQIDSSVVEVSTPATIREMIEQQLERLSAEEQRVIEVASVAGVEFSAAAVAVGTETTIDEVEQRCTALARRGQFLQLKGTAEWPDGTIATRYGFLHALYQEVTYKCIPMGRRTTLHQRIGERTEAAYGKHANTIATELAVHFEHGRSYAQAILYLQLAVTQAEQRSAHHEACHLLTTAIRLLHALPDTPERLQQEIMLYTALAESLLPSKGYAAPEVEHAYAHARRLCQQLGETPQLFPVLYGLSVFYLVRADLRTASQLAEQGVYLAYQGDDAVAQMVFSMTWGSLLFTRGEFLAARTVLEQSLELYPLQEDAVWGAFRAVSCLSYTAWVLWLLGYPDQAYRRSLEALTLAREIVLPFGLTFALVHAAIHRGLRWEEEATLERATEILTLSRDYGFPLQWAEGMILRGWALAEQGQAEEGIAQIRQGITAWRATGAELWCPYFLALLAQACQHGQQTEEGISALNEAIERVSNTEERFYEAELYRLKGELTLQQASQKSKVKGQKSKVPDPRPLTPDPQGEAEACFLKAIKIARHQQAKSWELRVSTSLARLWQSQDKKKEAHKLLSEIYNWFTEGFDTKDLQEAKALLEELTYSIE